jgi:hypothetical protein
MVVASSSDDDGSSSSDDDGTTTTRCNHAFALSRCTYAITSSNCRARLLPSSQPKKAFGFKPLGRLWSRKMLRGQPTSWLWQLQKVLYDRTPTAIHDCNHPQSRTHSCRIFCCPLQLHSPLNPPFCIREVKEREVENYAGSEHHSPH